MGRLNFTMMASLDGFVNDAQGDFEWGQIDAAVHQHANDEARGQSTHIYGRRMYECMVAWETLVPDSPQEAEFAELWKATDKVVVSRSLPEVASARTRLVRSLDVEALRQLKAESSGNLCISGPTLACQYLNAGVIDEVGIYSIPVLIGSGTPMFQGVSARLKCERLEEVAFANGVVFARYGLK